MRFIHHSPKGKGTALHGKREKVCTDLGIPLLENQKVPWFLGLWFLEFVVSCFEVSQIEWPHITKFPFHVLLVDLPAPSLEGHQAAWDMKLSCVLHSPCCLLPNCLCMVSAAILSDWLRRTQKTLFSTHFPLGLNSGPHLGGHERSSNAKAVSKAPSHQN